MSIINHTGDFSTSTMTDSIYGQGYVFPNITTAPVTGGPWWNQNTYTTVSEPAIKQKLTVEGDSEFKGDVKIKGKSLLDKLESIEERLAILHPNPELEEKWENLRGLRKMYMDLEREIIEQEKMWSILKK